jgi:signal transduction histidine kinase
MFDNVLKHRSGRAIALARLVLAAVFLLAIWADSAQPANAQIASYALLTGYLVFAVAVVFLVWDNWWREAKLAAPSHLVDILMFTLLVLVSDGYTSPFFVFFMFLLVSSAIRWGWRETGVTAAAVILFYFGAGILAGYGSGAEFDLQRFIIRGGNLVTLSALIIWFGINHGFGAFLVTKDNLLPAASLENSPLETAVEGAARASRADCALLVWSEAGGKDAIGVSLRGTQTSVLALTEPVPVIVPQRPFLFDLARGRALVRGAHSRMIFTKAEEMLDAALAKHFGIAEGLAIPIRTDSGEGLLLLGGIKNLCTDHLAFALPLGVAIADHFQRHALLAAVEESAAARSRLAFARDLHDGIVQFLAGATFRVEAIRRSLGPGEQADRELADLKDLLLLEQRELRSAIGALRSDTVELESLAKDLELLCERLSRQWDIDCSLAADVSEVRVPMHIHLDTHQLVREAVANAVRHAGAKRVTVELGTEDSDLRLDIINDGSTAMRLKEGSPWSLRERVDEAGGTLSLASRETGTCVCITLPLDREARA